MLADELSSSLGLELEDAYRLSPLQEAMLFHTVASGAPDLYVVQQRIDIEGHLDVDRFGEAWSHVVVRHPALRTLFNWRHDRAPMQIVCRDLDVPVEIVDMTGADDPDAEIDARFGADLHTRFEIDRPPLMRIVLFRRRADLHTMMWSHHHLLLDGWSGQNVLNEVFAAYHAFRGEGEPDLAQVAPFRTYIEWLDEHADGAQEAFWRDHLAGFDEPTRLTVPQTRGGAGGPAERYRALAAPLSAELRDFAAESGVSLNTVLVGAMIIALGRHTARRDVALGVVATGRPPSLPGVESMVGMFINTLVLRMQIDDDAPVRSWLRQVQSRQTEVLQHENTPLTEAQRWSELGPGTTLTDVLFASWAFAGSGTSPGGDLRYTTVAGNGRTSFPVSITVEASDPIRVSIDFDGGDLSPATIEDLLGHYETLLGSIVTAPDQAVGTLEMFANAEHEDRARYNDTEQSVEYGSVIEAFAAQAASTPDATAARWHHRSLSYAELDRRSGRLAATILRVGDLAARRVALLLPRSPDLLVGILGVLKAGAAYIPVDRHLPADRIAYMLRDSSADLVVTSEALHDLLPVDAPQTIELPIDGDQTDLDYDIPVGPNDVAYIIYTSGSTGRPKGVEVTHRALANYVWWARSEYGGTGPVSFPLFTSPGFDLTVTSIFVPLVSGGDVVVYPDDDVRDLAVLDVFADDRVDVVKLTPSHLALLDETQLETRRIRTLVVGGEDLRADLAGFVHAASGGALTVYNEYGPTEATVGCMIHRFDPTTDGGPSVPIGHPIANTRIHLLDRGLAPVPGATVGEIYVAGDGLARGYLDRPELTEDRFIAEPSRPGSRMYRTGDLGRWHSEGVIEYAGRIDDQLKVRGHRVEPGEIESVLSEHEGVSAAAVAPRRVGPGDVRLVAYYVPRPGATATAADLRRHLRRGLPEHMLPSHLVPVDSLPLNANGKLDRDALPETLGEVTTSATFVAPRTSTEKLVTQLSADLIGVDRVGITDNFFELGGHSILAMRLIARLHDETGVRLSPRVVLLNTLEQVAAQLPGDIPDVAASEPVPHRHGSNLETTTSAFYFGPESQLFGIHHAPHPSKELGRAVVLCHPVGWEYLRSHWSLRKIARLLAAEGFHVLRFDYFGTGDSAGHDSDAHVGRWLADISTAADEISGLAAVDAVSVVGVRLGASLAAVACSGSLPADRLVMWDPVVQGSAYLRTLERMHAEMLQSRRGKRLSPDMQGDELLGFAYPTSRRRDLAAIDLVGLEPAPIPSTLIASQPRLEYRRLVTAWDGSLVYDVVDDTAAWDELSSTQTTLLPARVPRRVVSALRGAP